MHLLWIISVSLHLLSVAVWIGGMGFLGLVLVPLMRGLDRPTAAALTEQAADRFRVVGWIALAVLLVTGIVQLWVHGVVPSTLFVGQFGKVLAVKLAVVAAIAATALAHDLLLPASTRAALRERPDSEEALRARRLASQLGRLTALLSLAALVLGVMLVRGVP